MKFTSTLTAIGALALMVSTAGLTAAHADNGKSNGNSSSHTSNKSHGKSAKSTVSHGNGALASELKGLNAVKANPNALNNAAPNSQVGRIATYRDAALVTGAKLDILNSAKADLAALPVPTRSLNAIDADIAALDPLALDYAAHLATLQAERTQTLAYGAAVAVVNAAATELATAQAVEDAALLIASDGRQLSDAAIAYIRSILNL